MVFGTSVVGIRGFATTRPPLVVFTLCLTAFALTTLTLAYLVGHQAKIQNSDAHTDWNLFLSFLGSKELCLQSTDIPLASWNSSHNFIPSISDNTDVASWGNVSITVTAELDLKGLLHNVSYVQGLLPLTGWQSLCDSSEISDVNLGVSFSILQNASQQEVCVTFTGPRSLLPAGNMLPSCSLNLPVQGYGASVITRSSPLALGERVDEWCRDGTVARMTYKANPHNALLLTVNDRSLINLHLVHTSYFLLVMAMTLICYALIRGKPKNKSLSIEKVPLEP